MMIAHVDGERRLAAKLAHKRQDCRCPGCALPVLARVGEQRAPHWAHVRRSDCPVAAGETDWHRAWKSLGQPHEIEVLRPEWPGHRADLCLVEQGQLQVIELQHSGITLETIRQRELAYGDVVWIVDVSARSFSTAGDRFQWKRASIVWSEAEQVIFDDGKAVHGRLSGAAQVPRIGEQLLFTVQMASGPIASWPRPADRASLVALLAAFKSVRGDYLAAREAEHQAWVEQERKEQERQAAARRDSWFRPFPRSPASPPDGGGADSSGSTPGQCRAGGHASRNHPGTQAIRRAARPRGALRRLASPGLTGQASLLIRPAPQSRRQRPSLDVTTHPRRVGRRSAIAAG